MAHIMRSTGSSLACQNKKLLLGLRASFFFSCIEVGCWVFRSASKYMYEDLPKSVEIVLVENIRQK